MSKNKFYVGQRVEAASGMGYCGLEEGEEHTGGVYRASKES